MGRQGKGGRQQPGDFLDKHAGRCSWSSVWLLSLLVQRAGSMGPLSLFGQADPARWHPTRAAGKRGPTLPVPTASVRVFGAAGVGEGGSQDKHPSMSPRGGLPSWGRRREKGQQCRRRARLCASALLQSVSPPEMELSGQSTLALLLFFKKAKHILASSLGLCSCCSLGQEHPFPRSPHHLLLASFVSIQVVISSERLSLTTLSEHDLTP